MQDKLKYGRRYIKSGYFWLICGGVVIGTLLALEFLPPSLYLDLALFTWAEFVFFDLFRGYRASIRAVKDSSYGKISYFQYKNLLKSGELDKWEEYAADLEKGNATGKVKQEKKDVQENAQEPESVTLTTEEIAVLKKLMDKKIVKNIEALEQAEKSNKTATSADDVDDGKNV